MSSYFDPISGWVTPANDVESETHGSLKDVLATLKKIESSGVTAPDDFYSAVERILYRYSIFIQHGIREDFGKHKGVSWYLVELGDGRDVVSYQDGAGHEWCELCLADEVPLWHLIGLLRRIERRKPLGDQEADETIESLNKLDVAYKAENERLESESNKDRQLNILKRSRFYDIGSDGE